MPQRMHRLPADSPACEDDTGEPALRPSPRLGLFVRSRQETKQPPRWAALFMSRSCLNRPKAREDTSSLSQCLSAVFSIRSAPGGGCGDGRHMCVE